MTIEIKVNALSLINVLRRLQIAGDKAYKSAHAIHKELVTELFKRIKFRTPVGNPADWEWPAPKNYKPGTLKKSWKLKFNGVSIKQNIVATISNPQPYAKRVEYGWSYKQAPQGMVRVTLKEFQPILKKAALKWQL